MPATDIVTPEFIRNAVLPTVKFVGRDGASVSDDFFYQEIDNAISLIEDRTGLALRIDHRKQLTERKDSLDWHDETWFLKKTLKRPVRSVTKFGFQYGGYPVEYLPTDWIHVASHKMGQVQLIPGPSNTALHTRDLWFPSLWNNMAHYVAGVISIEYYAGYDHELTGTHTATPGSTTVTITGTDVSEQALDFEPGMWIKLGPNVRRIARIIDGTSYVITNPVSAPFAGTAILLKYPGTVLKAIGSLAGAAMLPLAESLLFGTPGLIGKHLSMDGMSQSKSFNRRGPYAAWRDELLAAAEAAIQALHIEHTPIRAFAI